MKTHDTPVKIFLKSSLERTTFNTFPKKKKKHNGLKYSPMLKCTTNIDMLIALSRYWYCWYNRDITTTCDYCRYYRFWYQNPMAYADIGTKISNHAKKGIIILMNHQLMIHFDNDHNYVPQKKQIWSSKQRITSRKMIKSWEKKLPQAIIIPQPTHLLKLL